MFSKTLLGKGRGGMSVASFHKVAKGYKGHPDIEASGEKEGTDKGWKERGVFFASRHYSGDRKETCVGGGRLGLQGFKTPSGL